MSSDKLSGGMNHDVRPVRKRAQKVWRSKRTVHDQYDAMPVGNLCNLLNIHQISARIADGFHEQCLGILLYRSLPRAFFVRIYECSGNPLGWKRMFQKIIGPAIYVLAGHDMISCLSQILECISDGCRS